MVNMRLRSKVIMGWALPSFATMPGLIMSKRKFIQWSEYFNESVFMKKERKVFIISWFCLIGTIIACLAALGLIGFSIYWMMEHPEDLSLCIIVLVITVVISIYIFIMFGILFWQWVVIDGNKIKARNIFSIIREITWDEVDEVYDLSVCYHPSYPIVKMFVFVDNKGGKKEIKSPLNIKGQCIRIKANKRTRKFLLQLKPDLKITQYNGE